MQKAGVNTEFNHAVKPESVRLYSGSHVLCVTASGVTLQGEIIDTKDVTRNKETTRFLLLKLKATTPYVSTRDGVNTPPASPEAVGRSLLDGVGGS